HHALDADRAGAVAEELGDALLLVVGEPVAAAARVRVKEVPDAPEHLARLEDLRRLAGDEGADAHELVGLADAEARLCGPARDVEVAEAAFAVLHVGLEQVHGAAEAAVALCDLGLEAG